MSEFDNIYEGLNAPYSLDSEQSVLGAVLLDPNCMNDEKVAELKPEHFYLPQHKAIFSTLFAMSQLNKPMDFVTILEELRSSGSYEQAGGKEYLAQLAQLVPSVANVRSYAQVVYEKFLVRSLIKVGREIVTSATEGTDSAELQLDAAEQRLYDIRKGQENSDLVVIKDILATETLDHLTALDDPEQRKKLAGIPTGFSDVDAMIGGLNKSDLIIVGARPGMGKTSFILNLARNAAKTGKRIAFFSLEMSRDQLAQRLLSLDSSVGISRLRKGGLTPDEWDRIATATGELYNAKIFVDESSAITVQQIKAKVRRNKPDVVFIDYLQLLTPVTKSDNRAVQVQEMTRDLKIMAKELAIPVVVCSQLSRAGTGRGVSHVPQLSDLRESGAIEQDADIVIMLHRPGYYKDGSDGEEVDENEAQVIIAKHRHGETGTVKMYWDGRFARFVTIEKNEYDEY